MHRLLLAISLIAAVVPLPDRRIVDRVTIGDVRSEESHAYAGDGVTQGTANGRAFKETRGWMRFALTVFDDTEVSIAGTWLGSAEARTFELIVENQVVATHTVTSAELKTIEIRVPFAITKGKTSIIVVLRAVNGSTPALVELRSVQDHNE